MCLISCKSVKHSVANFWHDRLLNRLMMTATAVPQGPSGMPVFTTIWSIHPQQAAHVLLMFSLLRTVSAQSTTAAFETKFGNVERILVRPS